MYVLINTRYMLMPRPISLYLSLSLLSLCALYLSVSLSLVRSLSLSCHPWPHCCWLRVVVFLATDGCASGYVCWGPVMTRCSCVGATPTSPPIRATPMVAQLAIPGLTAFGYNCVIAQTNIYIHTYVWCFFYACTWLGLVLRSSPASGIYSGILD